nr:dynamin family protein [uncultured Acetatifactor sp.]
MTQVYVKYNPYRLETQILVNGREIEKDSTLFKLIKGKRLQEWIGDFPQKLRDELNSVEFAIEFCGMDLDWDDFEDVFNHAKDAKILNKLELKFTEGKSDDDIQEKIVNIFEDLKAGPIEDFRDQKLLKAFDNVNNSDFPIHVIATMSSGKSTLINALLEKRLMPSKNEACTATITEILDTDDDRFTAIVHYVNSKEEKEYQELTYEVMSELNSDENVHRIEVEGNIPFLDSRSTALRLVDTPGPNNSQNQEHMNTTYRAINNDSNSLILYVLNGTQLSTTDDAGLLDYVASQIKKGGKQVRDRFLFVVNKMDGFNPEEEDIGKAIQSVKKYLSDRGIKDPQIFPCSAYTALNIRTHLNHINIDNMTRSEERKLPSAARDTLPMIDKFIDHESMHLEKYSTLSPSAKRELDYKLKQAEERGDTKEQALIHCGIYSIEAAITAYVKKYARTKKVKDLVETFQEVLESNAVLVKAKERVATDEAAAKACAERAAAIRAKISNGEEAKAFKQRIDELNPIERIEQKSKSLNQSAMEKATDMFHYYGETINDREQAKRLVNEFARRSADAIAEMTVELESVINKEIMETGEECLIEYQNKLSKMDESVSGENLNFGTVDLIKGALNKIHEGARTWCSDEFADETVDEEGDVEYEEKVYYEKVGQEEEEVIVGAHEEKIGTRKIKVGSHKVKTGTRRVRNPEKRWWKILTPTYIEEDIYDTVDDYEDEDVYKTVFDYKTVIRDIYEDRKEIIEKFSVDTDKLQAGLVSKLRKNMRNGLKDALDYAEKQTKELKEQFKGFFDKLDQLIAQKYEELSACAGAQKSKEAELEQNRKLLGWIEACKAEIDGILEL